MIASNIIGGSFNCTRGLNLVFLMDPPTLIFTFSMLPDPIPYSELESLLLWQYCFLFVLCFLIIFLKLSNFLLHCTKDCLVGLCFCLPLLAARKSAFSAPSFLYLQQSFVLYVVYAPPWFLQRLQCFLMWAFLGTLVVDLVLGLLFPFLSLLEAFLLDCALDLSQAHRCSIVLRDMRSKCMPMGVTPFSWRLNWSCHVCGHIWRMWLSRSALAKGTFMGIMLGLALRL